MHVLDVFERGVCAEATDALVEDVLGRRTRICTALRRERDGLGRRCPSVSTELLEGVAVDYESLRGKFGVAS